MYILLITEREEECPTPVFTAVAWEHDFYNYTHVS